MRLNIKVIPRSSRNKITEEAGILKIYVTSPAVEGKANKAVIEALAEHFNGKKSMVSIISGSKSRMKMVEISGLMR